MRFVKMLEPVNGKEYALWQCGRCPNIVSASYKTGRSMRACYQCQRRQRSQEVEEVFAVKNINIAERTCLKCGRLFESKGNWNRRCPKCVGVVAVIEGKCNFKSVRHSKTMQLVGDCVVSDEELIRQLVY